MIEQIVDFLTTVQGSGHRRFYGWVWVLVLVVLPAAKAIITRERYDRHKRLINNTKNNLSYEHLKAHIISESDGVSKEIKSEIQNINGAYELVLSEINTNSIIKHTFSTIEELELFLETKTSLRLSDYKNG